MERITADDFIVTEPDRHAHEIAERFADVQAAAGPAKRAAFVQLLLAIEAPAEAGIAGDRFVAAWPVAAIGSALDQAACIAPS